MSLTHVHVPVTAYAEGDEHPPVEVCRDCGEVLAAPAAPPAPAPLPDPLQEAAQRALDLLADEPNHVTIIGARRALRSALSTAPLPVVQSAQLLTGIRKRYGLNAQTLTKAPEDERLRERTMNRDIGALLAHIDGASATEEPLYPRGWVDDSDPQKALAEVMGDYDDE